VEIPAFANGSGALSSENVRLEKPIGNARSLRLPPTNVHNNSKISICQTSFLSWNKIAYALPPLPSFQLDPRRLFGGHFFSGDSILESP
jgi:hypothetical protein